MLFVFATAVCGQKSSSTEAEPKPQCLKTETKVTYIANEGVLIEAGAKKILIDGLHRFYKNAYAFPPTDLKELLEGAKKPYDEIDLVLVSHLHGDHFHPVSVANHLVNNSRSRLATSKQIIGRIKDGFADYGKITTQIEPIEHNWKQSFEKDFDGVKVKFLGLRHGSERFKWIENLGHLIEAGGKKFLHIGDADMSEENFSAFKLYEESIDVAFIPYWYLLSKSGRTLVEKQFKPKHVIAVHVSPSESASVTKKLNEYDSSITTFTKILETKTFK